MIVKQTTQIGDPVIRSKAKPAPVRSKTTKTIICNLIDSMRFHGLVGMAAPQISIGKRIFVTEIRKTKTRTQKEIDEVRVFINPKFVYLSKKKQFGFEGCGSVTSGGLFAKVLRSSEVVIDAYNEKGKRVKTKASGLLASIIQHEFDHLEGTVFLDRLPNMRGLMSREEYLKKKFH